MIIAIAFFSKYKIAQKNRDSIFTKSCFPHDTVEFLGA